MSNYKTVLADAAEVDRKELPYALLYIKSENNGHADTHVSSCISNRTQNLVFAEAMMQHIGQIFLGEMYEEKTSIGHLSSEEQKAIIGLSATTTTIVNGLTDDAKHVFASMMASIVTELIINKKSVHQAAVDIANKTEH